MEATVFVLACLTFGVPPSLALHSYDAGVEHSVDPYVIGSYLITEHPGGRYSGECSDHGACGPFQLVYLWEEEFGGCRDSFSDSAHIFAQLVVYSQEKHGEDKWRSAIKCKDRDKCSTPRKHWITTEEKLRQRAELLRSVGGLLDETNLLESGGPGGED